MRGRVKGVTPRPKQQIFDERQTRVEVISREEWPHARRLNTRGTNHGRFIPILTHPRSGDQLEPHALLPTPYREARSRGGTCDETTPAIKVRPDKTSFPENPKWGLTGRPSPLPVERCGSPPQSHRNPKWHSEGRRQEGPQQSSQPGASQGRLPSDGNPLDQQ